MFTYIYMYNFMISHCILLHFYKGTSGKAYYNGKAQYYKDYYYDIISLVTQSQRHPNTFNSISCRTEFFKNSFFLCVIGEWNKLNPEVRRSGNCYNTFRKSILNFIRPGVSKVYDINDAIGIKLITRLRSSFSHLREHRFEMISETR